MEQFFKTQNSAKPKHWQMSMIDDFIAGSTVFTKIHTKQSQMRIQIQIHRSGRRNHFLFCG